MKITNTQIYEKLICVEEKVSNQRGLIRLNTWMASTALTLVVGVIIGVFL